MKSARRFILLFIGLLIIPFVFIAAKVFFEQAFVIFKNERPYRFFMYGLFAYIPIFFLKGKKSFFYVLAHELSHAIAAMIFGGKILAVNLSEKNGSVKTDKDNIIIRLVPYCVPFYALVTLLVYFLLSIFAETKDLQPYFCVLFGVSLSHHFCFSIYYLIKGQSDTDKYGLILSLNSIFISNIICVLFMHDVLFAKHETAFFFAELVKRSYFFVTKFI